MSTSPDFVEIALRRLRASNTSIEHQLTNAQVVASVAKLAQASDFAIDTLCRQPTLLATLASNAATPLAPPELLSEAAEHWPARLRRFRTAESTRLIWRDVVEGADVDDILAGSTALAENCLQAGLNALENEFEKHHGVICDAQGKKVRLVVFGLGKLGGGELNFSSDVDLVYGYASGGESNGPRPLVAEEYFARLGQRLARLLDDVTADGFCHRVDLRLRPYGNAGRVALSFEALDRYFQIEGRDWERYAWIKARAVAGDIEAGEAWLQTLRPFVYRRYLDFTALDGLRAMKAMITAEVARRELTDDIKRGAGGIREIEFLAQALQLVHGGRDANLRQRGLRAALDALVKAGLLAADTAAQLRHAYRFLRVLENRIQMLRDAQTHTLPENEADAQRIAHSLGFVDVAALRTALSQQRKTVAEAFAPLMTAPETPQDASVKALFQAMLGSQPTHETLADAGFAEPVKAAARVQDFLKTHGVASLSDSARVRLNRVLPTMLQAAVASDQPDAALQRCLALLQSILRRTSYLALLDEAPRALARLVDVVARSAWLAERVAQYPLLLDELLDTRAAGPLPDQAAIKTACEAVFNEPDPEQALYQLNETRLAFSFRIALAALDARQPPDDASRQLAWLADAVCASVLTMARDAIEQAHGCVPDGRFMLIGYGSLGGQEMSFGSDLDVVFVYSAPDNAISNGPRTLEANRYYTRLAQKMVSLLETATGAGRLYSVDVRLRPDGANGLLVTSLESYANYQQTRAWTWEHQALVRARGIAGDATLLQAFEDIRTRTLQTEKPIATLREDITNMRDRMRTELDRSTAERFDLKQGAGGLVDLEFLLQMLVLQHATKHTELTTPRNSRELITCLARLKLLPQAQAESLMNAHTTLLASGLSCTLDKRPRLAIVTAEMSQARKRVSELCAAHGLRFLPSK